MATRDNGNHLAEDAKRLKKEISEWKARRKAAGLPSLQADLAELVGGISNSAVSQYANGKIPLSDRAVLLFASALGIHPSAISPRISNKISEIRRLKGLRNPGMVYSWHEFSGALSRDIESLPDVCSVESPDSHMRGIIQVGDVLVVKRRALTNIRPRDGVIIISSGGVRLASYHPHPDGRWWARLSDGCVLCSEDGLTIAYVVSGMPSLPWHRVA